MASGQQRAEKDSGEKQPGVTAVPVHRGGRAQLGERKGHGEAAAEGNYDARCGGIQLQSKKEQDQTQKRDREAGAGAGGGGQPSVD